MNDSEFFNPEELPLTNNLKPKNTSHSKVSLLTMANVRAGGQTTPISVGWIVFGQPD